ncbi:MAG: PLP-dependent aspartate aminotransferase family protein [Pseudoclavibacter sp.]|nr:PLP-dependent aspartate aminotransferase family protein [Pseudoclavibacter sp.]
MTDHTDPAPSPDAPQPLPSQALRPDTLAVHAGREDFAELGVHVPPLDLSTTTPLPGVETGGQSYERLAGGGRIDDGSAVYQRLWNGTTARFEGALARLEHAPEAVAFASGMAALTAAVLAASRHGPGRHVVGLRPLYGGTDHLLATGILGTECTFVRHAEEVAAAVREDTCLVVAESPANPTLELVDLRELARAAGHAPLLVDNTFATPVLQRPLELGATLVVHSTTKYIGGHGDVLGGVVACDESWAQRLRSVRAVTGAIAHPLASYLAHRGLATLPLRVRRQQESAAAIARALAGEPRVERVFYPGLPGGDPAGLVGTQMAGPGAMIALDLGSFERAAHTAEHTRLFTHAVSLGGVDSLVQHPAALTHRPVTAQAKPGEGILRLSIGLEDPEDLLADLRAALPA